jgi:hypothetical protein
LTLFDDINIHPHRLTLETVDGFRQVAIVLENGASHHSQVAKSTGEFIHSLYDAALRLTSSPVQISWPPAFSSRVRDCAGFSGRGWADSMSASGQVQWPRMGRFSWPLTDE